MIYRLIVLNGPARGQRITVPDTPVTLGRGEDCTFTMEDEEAAAHHAVVEHTSGGMFVRDLGTMSHILVNNHEVAEARLKHGDVLELGRTQFLVQVSVQAEVNGTGVVSAPRRRRTSPAFAALFFMVCLGVAGVLSYHFWPARSAEYIGPELTAIKADDIPADLPPQDMTGGVENGTATVPDSGTQDSLSSAVQVTNVQPGTVTDATAAAGGASTTETVMAIEPPRTGVDASTVEVPAAVPPEPDPLPPTTPTDLIGVDSVQQSRFPQAEEFAEMRLLKVRLVPKVPVDTIDASDIRVQVEFYDRDAQSGAVKPSKAIVTAGPLEPEGTWLPEQDRTLEATYVVPKSGPGFDRRGALYYGHVVRVYYGDVLQDVYARPLDLAKRPATPQP